jgi:phosphate starvation-inducible membrane PsiE
MNILYVVDVVFEDEVHTANLYSVILKIGIVFLYFEFVSL